jgi:hypothetical protein
MSAEDYIASLPQDRQAPFSRLLQAIRNHIDPRFEESASPAPAWAVPLSAFPAGYHCTPGKPLPYLSLVSQKAAITLHHFGLYMNPELTRWFVAEYADAVGKKPDMGKGCIRFRKPEAIPFDLIERLISKQSLDAYIAGYEKALNSRSRG